MNYDTSIILFTNLLFITAGFLGQVVQHGGVTCVGYTNLESRMASTASFLFGGNITNFLLHMEDKKEKKWKINLEDAPVRSICVAINGEALPPYVPPVSAAVAAPTKKAGKEAAPKKTVEEVLQEYKKNVLFTTAGTTTALGLSAMVPNAPMMSTFALSCWVGNNCVQGVSHALHSPLMAMTNAISGMTIVGGMLQLGGGLVPTTIPQALAATAGMS